MAWVGVMDKGREAIPGILRLLMMDPLEAILSSLPEEYKGVAKHYINAKIEFLRAIDEFVKARISQLEARLKEIEGVKRERVKVE
jgi:hypothetical protein